MCNRFINDFTNKVLKEVEKNEQRNYMLLKVDCERWGDNSYNIAEMVLKFTCKSEELSKNLFSYFANSLNFSNSLAYLEILFGLLKYSNNTKKTSDEIERYLNEEIELTEEDMSRIENDFQINGLNWFEDIEKNVGLMKVFDKFDYGCNRLFLIEDPTGIMDKMKRNGFLIDFL